MPLIDKIAALFSGSKEGIVKDLSEGVGQFFNKPEDKLKFEQTAGDILQKKLDSILQSSDKEIELFLTDTTNARNTNVQIETSDKAPIFVKLVPYIIDIAVFCVWGFMTIYILCTYLNFIKRDPGTNMEGILGMYATVTGVFGVILNFHRGNTANSIKNADKKQAMIEKMMDK